jgi:hypothetical protein
MKNKFIRYRGYLIEKVDLFIIDQKKPLVIYIVHEYAKQFDSLQKAKDFIDDLGR